MHRRSLHDDSRCKATNYSRNERRAIDSQYGKSVKAQVKRQWKIQQSLSFPMGVSMWRVKREGRTMKRAGLCRMCIIGATTLASRKS